MTDFSNDLAPLFSLSCSMAVDETNAVHRDGFTGSEDEVDVPVEEDAVESDVVEAGDGLEGETDEDAGASVAINGAAATVAAAMELVAFLPNSFCRMR